MLYLGEGVNLLFSVLEISSLKEFVTTQVEKDLKKSGEYRKRAYELHTLLKKF
jgi:hypothetical protein